MTPFMTKTQKMKAQNTNLYQKIIEGEDGVYDMETEDEYEDNDSGKGLAPIMHEKKHPLWSHCD